MFCVLGMHNWRENRRAVWQLEYVKTCFEFRTCTRCEKTHPDDQAQLDAIGPIQPVEPIIERVV